MVDSEEPVVDTTLQAGFLTYELPREQPPSQIIPVANPFPRKDIFYYDTEELPQLSITARTGL